MPGATLAILAGAAIGALVPLALTRVAVASWTLRDIERQLGEAKRQGWTKHFADAGDEFGFSSATLLSIASRETNMKNIIGDGGRYGIMQIDARSYPGFIKSGDWVDPRKNIFKAAEVLDEKFRWIYENIEKKLTCGEGAKKVSFKGATLTQYGILRTTIASYNNGCWPYYAISTYGDPDKYTSGGDYSNDVINRREAFTRLLT
jgi:hypothetical protein